MQYSVLNIRKYGSSSRYLLLEAESILNKHHEEEREIVGNEA